MPHAAVRAAATLRSSVLLALSLTAPLGIAGCNTYESVKATLTGPPNPYAAGFVGIVSADEPRAALVGRDVLARGGNAADAAAAVGLALSVTLPSRASLGAGGACIARSDRGRDAPEAFLFSPVPGNGGGDRPAAVPMLARGLFLLQSRQGSVAFGDLVQPAAQLARGGVSVSKALADDLAAVGGPLLADPAAAGVFAGASGAPLAIGDRLAQPQLADTLDQLGRSGVGDLYTGALAARFANASVAAGGDVSLAALRAALPRAAAPDVVETDGARLSVLPPPADGGAALAAAYRGLQGGVDPVAASQQAAASLRGSRLQALPASTSFTVMDAQGGAVACALTMDNLFGTGRIAPGTGIVLAASPSARPVALLPVAIATAPSGALRAAVAASGQGDAAAAAASALSNALRTGSVGIPATAEGRVNAIVCPAGAAGTKSCTGSTDPRGAGLSLTSG